MLAIGIAISPVFVGGVGASGPSPAAAAIDLVGGGTFALLPCLSGEPAQIGLLGQSAAVSPIPAIAQISLAGQYAAAAPIPVTATVAFTGYAPTLDAGGGSYDTNWWWM
jgi:hypothetical protein